MNNNLNVTEQLELSINGPRPVVCGRRQRTRIERAAWWFSKMRQAVDAAIDGSGQREVRPQQLWIAQTQRQVAL